MTNEEISATVRSKDFRAFHNRLRILLHGLSVRDLKKAGLTHDQVAGFVGHPSWFFTRCDDTTAAAIWELMQAQQPEELK